MEDSDSGSEDEDLADLRLDTVRTRDTNDNHNANMTTSAKRIKYPEQKCYVCKDMLGADINKRMGGLQIPVLYLLLRIFCLVCAVRDCGRSSAHMACINLRCPKSFLPTIRPYFKCPKHAPKVRFFFVLL